MQGSNGKYKDTASRASGKNNRQLLRSMSLKLTAVRHLAGTRSTHSLVAPSANNPGTLPQTGNGPDHGTADKRNGHGTLQELHTAQASVQGTWGPKNTQKVLQKAERVFNAMDSLDARITAVDVSACGRFLAFTQAQGGTSIFDLSSGKPMFIHEKRVLDALAIWSSPDTPAVKLVMAGDARTEEGEHVLRPWDISLGHSKGTIAVPDRSHCVKISSDGSFILCGGREFLEVIEMSTHAKFYQQTFERETIFSCDFNPTDAAEIAFGGSDQWLVVMNWAFARGERSNKMAWMFTQRQRHQAEGSAHSKLAARNSACGDDRCVRCFHHGAVVSSVIYHPSGEYVLSGGGASAIMWGLEEGEAFRIFTHPDFAVNVQSLGLDANIWLMEKCKIPGISGCSFNATGEQVVISGEDRVVVWHVHTGGRLHSFLHREQVNAVAFTPNGSVCAGGDDWSVTVRDVTSEVELRSIAQPGVGAVADDGQVYFLNDMQGHGEVRGLRTNEIVCQTHTTSSNPVALSPSSKYLAMSVEHTDPQVARIGVWDLTAKAENHSMPAEKRRFGTSRRRSRSKSGRQTHGACDHQGHLHFLEDFHVSTEWQQQNPFEFKVEDLQFSPKDHYLAVAVGYYLFVLDVAAKFTTESHEQAMRVYQWHEPRDTRISCIAFSSDSKQMATGVMFKGMVYVHEIEARLQAYSEYKKTSSVANRILGKQSTDEEYDDVSKSSIHESGSWYAHKYALDHGKATILGMKFSPNGKFLITSTGDSWIWNLKTRQCVKRLDDITNCKFSMDGDYVVAVETNRPTHLVLFDAKQWTAARRFKMDSRILNTKFVGQEQPCLMTRTETGVRLWDFERVRSVAPPAFQLFNTYLDLKYIVDVVDKFPFLLYETVGQITFVQFLVREGMYNQLQSILDRVPDAVLSTSPLGSVFDFAMDVRDRNMVKILLTATCNTTQVAAREPIVNALPRLISMYPDLVAEFFCRIGLEEVTDCNVKDCRIANTEYIGSHDQNAMFIWDNYRGAQESKFHITRKSVAACKVALPGFASIQIIAALSNPDTATQKELFDNEVIESMTSCLWSNYVWPRFRIDFSAFVFMYFIFCYWAVLAAQQARQFEHCESEAGELDEETDCAQIYASESALFSWNFLSGKKGFTKFRILGVLDMVFIVACARRTYSELTQLRKNGVAPYFTSVWNFVDIASIGLQLTVSVLHQLGPLKYYPVNMLIASGLMLTLQFKLLSYMRALPNFGFMVRMIIQIVEDLYYFGILTFAFLWTFSVAFFLVFAVSEEDTFRSLGGSFLTTFLMFLGDWDTDVILSSESLNGNWTIALFVMFLLIGLVMLLNVIIALLSDSYATVKTHSKALGLRERVTLINEFLEELPREKFAQFHSSNRWVHCLIPREQMKSINTRQAEPGHDETGQSQVPTSSASPHAANPFSDGGRGDGRAVKVAHGVMAASDDAGRGASGIGPANQCTGGDPVHSDILNRLDALATSVAALHQGKQRAAGTQDAHAEPQQEMHSPTERAILETTDETHAHALAQLPSHERGDAMISVTLDRVEQLLMMVDQKLDRVDSQQRAHRKHLDSSLRDTVMDALKSAYGKSLMKWKARPRSSRKRTMSRPKSKHLDKQTRKEADFDTDSHASDSGDAE